MKKLPHAPHEPAIPGEARDDVDRLKMLWLRANGLDQAAEKFNVDLAADKGGGWSLAVITPAGCHTFLRRGPCATALLREEVEKLSRALVLRARSDLAALQLCGVQFEPFDVPGEGAVEPAVGREDPEHEFFVVRFVDEKDYRQGAVDDHASTFLNRIKHDVTPSLKFARRWRTRERAARDESYLGTRVDAFTVVPAQKGVAYIYPPVGDEPTDSDPASDRGDSVGRRRLSAG